MDEEDYLNIEDQLAALAQRLGAPDVLDNRYYRRRDVSNATEYLLPTRERVLEKLRALERLLALMDRGTFIEAMDAIRTFAIVDGIGERRFSGPAPQDVKILDDFGDPISLNFNELPDMRTVRQVMRHLESTIEGDA